MSERGTVEGIYLADDSGEPMEETDAVEAVADRGLRGDRYFHDRGIYDRNDDLPDGTDATLIEAEALDALSRDYDVDLPAEKTRRNLLTRGVGLNHLVGRRFRVGDAVMEGVRLCEPCSYMEGLAEVEGAEEGLVHRGGLNANVVETGEIAVGDGIEVGVEVGSDDAIEAGDES